MSVHYHSTPQCEGGVMHDSCNDETVIRCTRIQTEPEELFECEHPDPPAPASAASASPQDELTA